MKVSALGLVFFALSSHYALAQSFDKGAVHYRLEEVLPFAENGNPSAQVVVGSMYTLGLDSAAQDFVEGVKWYKLAAMQGNTQGQHMLGISHLTGEGALKSNIMAHMWFNISAAKSTRSGSSAIIRDSLETHMSRADLAQAQAMARECMSSGYTKCGY